MATCSVSGCSSEAKKRGFCIKHYGRWQRHGDPNVILYEPAHRRWKVNYAVDPRTECWLWTGYIDKRSGYGYIRDGAKKKLLAHRFVYEQVVGLIPEGLELDHKCRNRSCVNPRHLDPVTHAVNQRRGNAGMHQAVKTHCKHGHEFTTENTMYNKRGQRGCRECHRRISREAVRRYRERNPREPKEHVPQTHCKYGHQFTAANTYIDSQNKRHCRECQRRRDRERTK